MINLYLAPSSSSSRRAKKWLINHDIEFTERDISKQPLTADDIKCLLRLSENGTEDLISTRCTSYRKLKINFDNLTVSQLIDLMVQHTDLIADRSFSMTSSCRLALARIIFEASFPDRPESNN